jgi:NodT family efflux transporter outer membrane factor (OMF) lipoprotein
MDRAMPPFVAWLSMLLLLILLCSCAVGPNYAPPSAPQSQAWQKTPGVTTGQPDAAWWQKLNDPILVTCIERAVANNQDLKAAAARVREARARRGIAAADLWPSVKSNAGYTHSRSSENAGFLALVPFPIDVDQDLHQIGFDASWELDIFGGRRRLVEAATARTRASVDSLDDVLLSIMAEVGRNYVALRGAQRQLAVAESNSRIQADTLAVVESKFAAKIGSELEVEQARAQLEQTRSTIPPLRAAIRAGAYSIAVLTGDLPAALLDELLQSQPIPVPPDVVPVGLPSDLLRRRPDLRQAERDLHATTADIGVATADLFPRFYLTGATSFQSMNFVDLFRANSFAWSLGPSVVWPVFQGGRIRSNIALNEAKRDEVLANYRQAVLNALKEVETSLVNYAERQVERDRLATSLQSQARAVQMARAQYREGLKDFQTVLDAERRLNEVENSLAVSETRVVTELIGLYKALGGGWEQMEGRLEPPTTVDTGVLLQYP